MKKKKGVCAFVRSFLIGLKEMDMVHRFKTDFDFVFVFNATISNRRIDEQVERGVHICRKVSKKSTWCIHLKLILILYFVFNATIPKKLTWCIHKLILIDR